MLISAKEIIVASWNLYKQHATVFLKYMGILLIPNVIISILLALFAPNEKGEVMINLGSYGALAMIYILVFIGIIITVWISIAFTREYMNSYLKKGTTPIQTMLQNSGHIIVPLILSQILFALILIVGFMFLIIPGIIFSIWFIFAMYGVIIDEKSIMESFKYSKKLVTGRWWAMLWRIVAPTLVWTILLMIPTGILSFISEYLAKNVVTTQAGFVITILTSVIAMTTLQILATPLISATPIILYAEAQKNPQPMKK